MPTTSSTPITPARTRMTTVCGFMAQDPFVLRGGVLPLSAGGLQPRWNGAGTAWTRKGINRVYAGQTMCLFATWAPANLAFYPVVCTGSVNVARPDRAQPGRGHP